MQSEGTSVSPPDTVKGLPPVAPPSGKFIAQLFLVPLMIVAVLVAAFFGLPWLLGVGFAANSPEKFLHNLKDSNPDIRWRAADDLAQFLQKDLIRDARWSSEPRVALDIAEQLHQAIEKHESLERATRQSLLTLTQPDDESKRVELLRKLDMERSYLEYLTACLGNLIIPAGVPLLSEIALKQEGVTPEVVALKRRQAVWSLANLGRNLERFTALPADRQEEILAQLDAETARAAPRGDWAKKAHTCLTARRDGKPAAMGLDVTLAQCASAELPELRKMTALALMYWEGNAQENQLMEQTLIKLSFDDGFGAPEDQRLRSLEVRYHAALALARRGSEKAPLALLQEMLSEAELEKNLRLRKDGRDVPDRDAAQATLANALKVVGELRSRRPERDLSSLQPTVEQLTRSSQAALRVEAERVLQLLVKK